MPCAASNTIIMLEAPSAQIVIRKAPTDFKPTEQTFGGEAMNGGIIGDGDSCLSPSLGDKAKLALPNRHRTAALLKRCDCWKLNILTGHGCLFATLPDYPFSAPTSANSDAFLKFSGETKLFRNSPSRVYERTDSSDAS
jgi:hypothetical protein